MIDNQTRGLVTRWTQHLKTEEDKQKFEKDLLGSKYILDRLREIVDEDERALNINEVNPQNYEVANWAYKQAHSNGVRQHINAMKKLLNLDHKDSKNEQLTRRRDPAGGR